jgi:tetratricopeptide (TPR) repeat protein
MMTTLTRAGLLCLTLLVLAACGSAAPPRPPLALEQADTAEREARRAFRDGDLAAARNLFEQSLRLQQSQDNLPGVAAAAINLAAVYHAMKNDELARRLLDSILGDQLTPYPPGMRVAAAFRKAVILVDGEDKEAATTLEAAAGMCGKACEFTPGIHNLRARMALNKKEYAAAVNYSRDAEGTAGERREELANARRYSAAAEAGLGQHAIALEHYLAALELDKQLGISARIAEDLDGAARALAQLGRKEEAAAYARRGAAAHDAARFKPGDAPIQ